MPTPLKTNPGLNQYLCLQGETTFTVDFYIYDVTAFSVYLTPSGNPPNDSAQLLTYEADYTASNNAPPNIGGTVYLTSASYPNGANAGDIITMFCEYGAAEVTPQYPYCSTADPIKDGILPVLQPGCVWMKSSNGSILNQSLPGNQSVVLPTVTNAAVRFNSITGSTESSNTKLSPTRIGQTYYDDVTGINNLTAYGTIAAGSGSNGQSTYSSNATVFGNVTATNLEASVALYVDHQYGNSYRTSFLGANNSTNDINYSLPSNQATVAGSFLSNDSTGLLSWTPQTSISNVGTITSGQWNAGAITSTGNITATGNVTANLTTNNSGGNGVFPTSVTTSSLVMQDNSGNPALNISPNSTTISSPASYGFTGNQNYQLPVDPGTTGSVLAIDYMGAGAGVLTWKSGVDFSLKRAIVRFTGSSSGVNVIYNYPYNVTVTRQNVGVYLVTFGTPFSGANDYIWLTSFLSNQNIVVVIPSSPAPTASSCTINIYSSTANFLMDPGLDVCVMFFGT